MLKHWNPEYGHFNCSCFLLSHFDYSSIYSTYFCIHVEWHPVCIPRHPIYSVPTLKYWNEYGHFNHSYFLLPHFDYSSIYSTYFCIHVEWHPVCIPRHPIYSAPMLKHWNPEYGHFNRPYFLLSHYSTQWLQGILYTYSYFPSSCFLLIRLYIPVS